MPASGRQSPLSCLMSHTQSAVGPGQQELHRDAHEVTVARGRQPHRMGSGGTGPQSGGPLAASTVRKGQGTQDPSHLYGGSLA